jgi:hypothetical protein
LIQHGLGSALGFASSFRSVCACVLVACSVESSRASVQTQVNPAQRAPALTASGVVGAASVGAIAAVPAENPAPPGGNVSDSSVRFVASDLEVASILTALGRSELRALRPVGRTSTVFRAQLDAPFRAAFKAATQRRPFGYIAEVAAYRLARCLGFDNVPPAVMRRVPAHKLRQELDAEYVRRWPSIASRLATSRTGDVEGAAIFWIEGLRNLDLANPLERARVQRLLQLAEPLSEPVPPLAARLSSLQAFDYLIGNWDRWSGGNVKGDASGQILYARDQDAAFPGRLSETLQRRLLDPVLATERFSRRFVERLRALTRSVYERELAGDAVFAEQPRLDERSLVGVFDRRAALLSHVSALIEEHGEEQVLAFP